MYNMPSDMRRRPKHQKSMYDTYMERKAKEEGWVYEAPKHNPNEVNTMRFKGSPELVWDRFNKWVSIQNRDYPDTFEIIDTTTIPMPSGAFLIVLYKY